MTANVADPFLEWMAALEARYLRERTFAEMSRSIRTLSSLYVERREKLGAGRALTGAGKRAAFALYFGPLHFLLVRRIVRALGAAVPAPVSILDLGCGSGVAGAAWAIEAGGDPKVMGVDRSAWALAEARWNLRVLGLRGRLIRQDVSRVPLPDRGAVIAAFAVNELDSSGRARLLGRLVSAARRGVRILIVEPIAISPFPWWREWASRFSSAGGRAETWRFKLGTAELPELIWRLDRASGLDHRELTARTLWL